MNLPLGTPVLNLTGNVIDPTTSSQADNSTIISTFGKQGEQLASELHGRFYTAAYRGRTFTARTAHGGAVVPVYTATAQTFAVINPSGSGVNLEMLRFRGDIAATGTAVIAELYLNAVYGSAFTTLMGGTVTLIANGVQNMLVGAGANPKSQAASAVTSVNQADTYVTGLGCFPATAVTSAGSQIVMFFDGGLIIPPATCIFVTSLVAQTSIMHLEFTYNELPV